MHFVYFMWSFFLLFSDENSNIGIGAIIIIITIIISFVVYRITFLWVVFLLMYLVSICAHIVGGSS